MTVEACVIVGVRAAPEEAERARNAKACLEALNNQDIERTCYEIVLVEQDGLPRVDSAISALADRYIFAPNPGLYNRGWAFNIGARNATPSAQYLFLLDADVLLPPDSLRRSLEVMRTGAKALRPFNEALFLGEDKLFVNPMGLCIWVRANFYREIGGHDERFRGWGWEDREFWERLERRAPIERLPDRISHMYHPTRVMNDVSGAHNFELFETLMRANFPIPVADWGDISKYATAAALPHLNAPPSDVPDTVLFSIVMPTYRRAHTIGRAVESIRAQTEPRWELIVVNNAPDGEYVFDDPRIRVCRHASQASASYARNAGLQYATGEFVCFFDDDDEMLPHYLRRIGDAFRDHPRAGMVTCRLIRPDGSESASYATPACCARREFVTPDWIPDHGHDKVYFRRLAELNGLSIANGGIVQLNEALCRAWADAAGGLRRGDL